MAQYDSTRAPNPQLIAELDILLTSALARFGYHLRFGKVNPESLDPKWNFSRELNGIDPIATLQAAIDAPSPGAYMRALAPQLRGYEEYKNALAQLREVERNGGWPQIAKGPSLKAGMEDERVPALRRSLAVRGFLSGASAEEVSLIYDTELQSAVAAFQSRHGLEPDGVVGPATLAALNVPVGARIDQIRANMERTRWVFRDIEPEFIVINVAGFDVFFVRRGDIIWRSRVQVGRPYRQTPVFKAALEYLVFNPDWTVPPTILRNDILPKVRIDEGYLEQRNIRVIDRNGNRVDPGTIDWSMVRSRNFPYQLRQDPGADNALGRVKFVFPNRYTVFLHDTPSQRLFERTQRTFSSGCIRVERALELAELLLDDPAKWNRAAIDNAIASGHTQTVLLPKPVTIMLLYWTVGFDADWNPIFLKDVYSRDQRVIDALKAPFVFEPPGGYPEAIGNP
jgi:murein L,D-transpeptidase YcbB/YkuD